MCDLFAENVNLWDELFDVIDAGDEDLILDALRFGLGGSGEWLEAVDDVVAGVSLDKSKHVELTEFVAAQIRWCILTPMRSRSNHWTG